MTDREHYTPGPASGAQIRKDGEKWTLVLVREMRHSPEKVWQALTDPAHLREWAPFEADGSLGTVGTTVKLTTVAAPTPHVTETKVTRADAPRVLEYNWGDHDMRWELEGSGGRTRLTLWTNIGRRFISMGAAGWHICFDVLDRLLSGTPSAASLVVTRCSSAGSGSTRSTPGSSVWKPPTGRLRRLKSREWRTNQS